MRATPKAPSLSIGEIFAQFSCWQNGKDIEIFLFFYFSSKLLLSIG